MPKPFHELRERLLRAGVAPRHVRRYLAELADHLADLRAEEERAGRSRADAEVAALIRLGGADDLAKAMIERREFQSLCVRAPWAMFGLAPLFFLAVAWLVALFILWSGWQIFLPEADMPFGAGSYRVFDLANLYFQVGRSLYLGAPILIGWGIGLMAARQRLNTVWSAIGFVLIALIGGTGQVHVSRAGGLYHVGMGFTFASSVQGNPYGLLHTLVILALTALPYLIWRLQKTQTLSAKY